MIKVLVSILLLGLTGCNSSKQSVDLREKVEKVGHTKDSAKKVIDEWHFFVPKKTVRVEVVNYYSAFTRCNRSVDNGLAIVLSGLDTIRIIDECPGVKNYMRGEKLLFIPNSNPPLNNELGIVYINEEPNPSIFSSRKIRKTAFGRLSKL
ncbi:hypothetical protein [Owenweeksia hongkongensis]|uniref:hypothetical protein n=1 Tax=Owenweeksia hongkongensis TaxID=253245 RepID=UPI003A94C276